MGLTNLTGFQRDVLFVLAGEERSKGTDVMSTLNQTQDRDLLPSRVYTNLDDLSEQGLIDKGKQDGRTNYYEITDKGLEKIEDRLEWQSQFISFDDVC